MKSFSSIFRLECDNLCLQVERNRQLAEAFNIEADPMPTPGAPTYTRFLRDFARTYTDFGLSVERALEDLIRTAKEVSDCASRLVPVPIAPAAYVCER